MPKQNLPEWFKVKLPVGDELERYNKVKSLRHGLKLHTVCEEAQCPNIHECWGRGTATFMILGDICTRACRFCDVKTGNPEPLDPDEPKHTAEAVKKLKLKYVVITSVTRDDLPDNGAVHFAETVRECSRLCPNAKIELLIPDFMGSEDLLKVVVDSEPFIVGHNIEVVESIYDSVRPKGGYKLALDVLSKLKKLGAVTKSALMVGHGENMSEVEQTLKDLRSVGCDYVAVGQYLAPSLSHTPVKKFYTPEEFSAIRVLGLELGFKNCVAGPLVRSSYMAEKAVGIHLK